MSYGYGYQGGDPTAPLGGTAYAQDQSGYGTYQQYPQGAGAQGYGQGVAQQGGYSQQAGYDQYQNGQGAQGGYQAAGAQQGYGAGAAQQQYGNAAQQQYGGQQQPQANAYGAAPASNQYHSPHPAAPQSYGVGVQQTYQQGAPPTGAPVAQAYGQQGQPGYPPQGPQQVPQSMAPKQVLPPGPVPAPQHHYQAPPPQQGVPPQLAAQGSFHGAPPPQQVIPPQLKPQGSFHGAPQQAPPPSSAHVQQFSPAPAPGPASLPVNPPVQPSPKLNAGAYANPTAKGPATVLSAQTAAGGTHSYTVEERRSFAEHLNQVLAADPALAGRLPMNPSDDSLFNVVADGVLLCKFINKVKPGSIPENKICTKSVKSPFEINGNHELAIAAARTLGCSTVNIGALDLSAGPKAAHLILGLLWQLIRMDLLNQVSLEKHPEMVALMAPTEDLKTFAFVAPEQNLLRWFNYHLKRAGSPRQVQNFSGDIKDSECYTILLNQLMPNVCTLEALRETDPMKRAEQMLQNAGKINCRKFVNAEDVVMGHPKLNLAFVAYLFNQHPGLESHEREDMEIKRKREAEIHEAIVIKQRAEADALSAMQAAEAARAEEEHRRQAFLAEEAARKAKWEADEASRKAKWDAEEAARLEQLQELDRRKVQLDAELARQRAMEQQQHDQRLAAEAEARRRALEAEENARRQRLLQEEEAHRQQWMQEEAMRQAARAEEERRRIMDEEARRQAAAAAEAERQRLENERKRAEDAAAWQRQQQLMQQQQEAQLAMEQAAAAAHAAQQQQQLLQQQQQEAAYAAQQQLLLQQQQQQQTTATYYAQQQPGYQTTTTTTYQVMQQPGMITQQTLYTGGFPIPRLFVEVVAARGLVKKELLGLMSSDPYCVAELAGVRYQSTYEKSTRNPNWHSKFEFRGVQATQELVVSIWDYDRVGKHDFMGEYRFGYAEFQVPGDRWYHLRSRPGHHDRVSGEVQVRIFPSS